jgi:TolA-binding protein
LPVRRRSNLFRFSALAAGLAASAAAGWLGLEAFTKPQPVAVSERAPARVELVYASGEVRVQDRSANVGDFLLAEGNTVEVGKGSCCLAIDPGIDVCLADKSRLRIARVGGAEQQVDLLAGRVTASLQRQPRGTSFSVAVDGTRITAVGTAFSVEVGSGDERVETTVLSGEVMVSGKPGRRLLRAHQKAVLGRSGASVQTVVRASESRHWALVSHTDLWKAPATAVLDLSRAPLGAEVVLNGRPIGQAPLSSLIPAGSHELELRLGGERLLLRPLLAEAGKAALQDFDFASSIQEQGEPVGATPAEEELEQPGAQMRGRDEAGKSGAGQLMRVARRLMQQGRWSEAAFAYREIRQAYPDSPEARTVLVPLGQIELDHLSRPAAARGLFELYLKGGSGPLAQEASHELIRALRRLGQSQREREAIERFLQRYPDSFQAGALEQRLEQLGGRPVRESGK